MSAAIDFDTEADWTKVRIKDALSAGRALVRHLEGLELHGIPALDALAVPQYRLSTMLGEEAHVVASRLTAQLREITDTLAQLGDALDAVDPIR